MAIFQFKQFSVAQDRCGMKISSVACVFAALISQKNFHSLLDIGTGTGVLSLMIAQRSAAKITALEMDTEAVLQAKENFERSEWGSRLEVEQANVITWAEQTTLKYDAIICNPPFFKKQSQSPDYQRNIARHSEELDAVALANISEKLLLTEGEAHFLVAKGYEQSYILAFSQKGFLLVEHTQIFAHPFKSLAFCHILSFSKVSKILIINRLYMQDEHLKMHEDYKKLMQDYLIIF